MPQKHRRISLREKDVRTLLAEASKRLRTSNNLFRSRSRVEFVEIDSSKLYCVDGKPLLAEIGGKIVPTLIFEDGLKSLPRAVVDMGAVPFVCKGANVMAPGIRWFEGEFKKGELIVVSDEKHGRALAVGEALSDRTEAVQMKQGPVIKSLHFVGDTFWNCIKEITDVL